MSFRVLHVITGLGTGGAETMLLRLLSRMDPKRFSSEVLSLADVGPMGRKIEALGIPVRGLRASPSWAGAKKLLGLAKDIRASQPQLVQTWMYHANLLGGLAARRVGAPVLWNIRAAALPPGAIKRSTAWISRACALVSGSVPARVIINSRAGLEEHVRLGYKRENLVVLPNGFDLGLFRPDAGARTAVRRELGAPENALLIGKVARFNPFKDHRNFVLAARELARVRPDAHFLLCGLGMDESNLELTRWIDEAGLRGRFLRLGRREDVPRLMAALDIAASSSLSEGFPNVIGEAMACGVPCVVTDVGESAYLVGDTGVTVPPRNPTALAGAWATLADEGRERLHERGQAARRRVQELFSIDAVAKQYEELYTRVAGTGQ